MNDIDKRWDDILPHILHYNETVNQEDLHIVNSKIREYYFGEKAVNRQTYGDLVKVCTKVYFYQWQETAVEYEFIHFR